MSPHLLLLWLLLQTVTALPGNTAETMREKYGQPISETFLVRPAVEAKATYGIKGQVCEIVVSPNTPVSMINSQNATISSPLLTEVVDELVPKKERGNYLGGAFLTIICLPASDCIGSMEDWQKLAIYYNAGSPDPHYATIQWKREGCPTAASKSGPAPPK